jgi:hypothetical protein
MALDDGRFLTTKDLIDNKTTKFEKVNPRFLVFALGKINGSSQLGKKMTNIQYKDFLCLLMLGIHLIRRFDHDFKVGISELQNLVHKWIK